MLRHKLFEFFQVSFVDLDKYSRQIWVLGECYKSFPMEDAKDPKFMSNVCAELENDLRYRYACLPQTPDEDRLAIGWIQQLERLEAGGLFDSDTQVVVPDGYAVAPRPAGSWRYTGSEDFYLRWLERVYP
jgi:hypothetical protein